MNSILNNRPALAREVNKVAETAGYLWEKGWAERNGGNITINITEWVDDEIRQMPAISEVYPIGATLPYLKGCYFFCKGNNRRGFSSRLIIRIYGIGKEYLIEHLNRLIIARFYAKQNEGTLFFAHVDNLDVFAFRFELHHVLALREEQILRGFHRLERFN